MLVDSSSDESDDNLDALDENGDLPKFGFLARKDSGGGTGGQFTLT